MNYQGCFHVAFTGRFYEARFIASEPAPREVAWQFDSREDLVRFLQNKQVGLSDDQIGGALCRLTRPDVLVQVGGDRSLTEEQLQVLGCAKD